MSYHFCWFRTLNQDPCPIDYFFPSTQEVLSVVWKMCNTAKYIVAHIDGLVQERCNSIANTLELRLSCTNPSICTCPFVFLDVFFPSPITPFTACSIHNVWSCNHVTMNPHTKMSNPIFLFPHKTTPGYTGCQGNCPIMDKLVPWCLPWLVLTGGYPGRTIGDVYTENMESVYCEICPNHVLALRKTELSFSHIYILVNSSSPNAAYMRQWMALAFVQIMACRLFGAKPLSEPMLGYYQLDPHKQTSMKF